MSDVLFPVMSSDNSEATGVISTWYVDSGEQVTPDTLIAEVAMDKVDAEVFPPVAGTITIVVGEGTEVAQGSVIAKID